MVVMPVLAAILLALAPAACLPTAQNSPAPALDSPEWLNTDREFRSWSKDLKGQVVLLDFWTYCCINCLHVLPDLAKLEKEFADQPFLVIGVHSNKFPQEGEAENIRQAILRYQIHHPVVVDQEHKIWKSFGVRAWPTLVLVDPEGNVVGSASGEGNYDLVRATIIETLDKHRTKGSLAKGPIVVKNETPAETMLQYPGKVLVNGDKLYVSDSTNHRVLEVKRSDGTQLREFRATEPAFNKPQGMAVHDGWLYLADTDNHLLRRIHLQDGVIETVAGTGVQARPLPNAGKALATPLNSPWALETVGDQIHVAMAGSHQLWTYLPKSGELVHLAGSGYENIVDGPAAASRLAQPSGLVELGGKLYFADSEVSAVRWVDHIAKEVGTVVGTHLFRFGDQDGEVASKVLLQHPLGLAAWKEKLVVADTYNNKIKLIDPSSGATSTLFGDGSSALSDTQLTLWEPGGIAVAGDQLYIADTNHHRVLAVNLTSGEWKVLLGPLQGRSSSPSSSSGKGGGGGSSASSK